MAYRYNRAAAALAMRGLALGDAFGETWLLLPAAEMEIAVVERRWNDAPWPWTLPSPTPMTRQSPVPWRWQ